MTFDSTFVWVTPVIYSRTFVSKSHKYPTRYTDLVNSLIILTNSVIDLWPQDDLWPHFCWVMCAPPNDHCIKSHENPTKCMDVVTNLLTTLSHIDHKWLVDDLWPHFVGVTCVILPEDLCVQVSWKSNKVNGFSDQSNNFDQLNVLEL